MPRGKQQRNPLSRTQKYMLGGAAALTALIGGVAIATREPAPAPKKKTTRRPSGELPEPVPAEGAAGPTCDLLGPEYPGYVVEDGRCVPSAATPPGIYLHSDCTDFDFVPGEGSTQEEDLQARIDDAVAATADYGIGSRRRHGAGLGVNPVAIAASFLADHWPQCPWPPPPDASSRVIQMFMTLAFAIGRSIYNEGGNVLGYDDPVRIDEEIVDALAAAGLTAPLDQNVVPELQLPPITREPPEKPEGFHPPEEPGPPQGGVVPPGGVFPGPGGGPPPPADVDAEQKPDCQIVPLQHTQFKELSPVRWSAHGEWNFPLVSVIDPACSRYRVRFGLCLKADSDASYGLLGTLAKADPTKTVDEASGNLKILIDHGGDGDAVVLSNFLQPYAWKRQFEVTIGRSELGKAVVIGDLDVIDAPDLDLCIAYAGHYPKTPSGMFRVNHVEGAGITPLNWRPEPEVALVPHPVETRQMLVRIRYQGLPDFSDIQGSLVFAWNNVKTGYKAYLKVDAIGLP